MTQKHKNSELMETVRQQDQDTTLTQIRDFLRRIETGYENIQNFSVQHSIEHLFEFDGIIYKSSASNMLTIITIPNEPPKTIDHTPTTEGHYWAKLVSPTDMPDGEDWVSSEWKVVQVTDNNGTGDKTFWVAVPGISVAQWLPNFIWGPRIPDHPN